MVAHHLQALGPNIGTIYRLGAPLTLGSLYTYAILYRFCSLPEVSFQEGTTLHDVPGPIPKLLENQLTQGMFND